MKIKEQVPPEELIELSKLKENAEIRDRMRAIVYASQGFTAAAIAQRLGYELSWVNRWARRYNESGLEGLKDLPRSGQPTKLNQKQVIWLQNRVEAGPLSSDKCNVFRGEDLQQIIEKQFDVKFSLSGIYALLSRLGYSHIKPRPVHPQNDPEAMAGWLKKNDAGVHPKNFKRQQ